jgi:hypothetical protein
MRWGNVSSFSIGADYTRVFKCIHRSKSEELRLGGTMEAVPKKPKCGPFSLFSCGELPKFGQEF